MNKLGKTGLFFLTNFCTKSVYYLKVNGFGACLKKTPWCLTGFFIKHQEAVLFEKDLSEIPGLVYPKGKIKVKMGTHQDVPRLTRLLPWCSASFYRDWLSRGDIFFLAQIDNQIVHQTWISFKDNWVSLLNKKIVLREGEAYLYQIYTAPKFRDKEVCTAVQRRVLRYLKAQGYQKCFFLVNLKEHPSTRIYERFFGPIEGTLISYWRIMGYRSYRYEPYRGVT